MINIVVINQNLKLINLHLLELLGRGIGGKFGVYASCGAFKMNSEIKLQFFSNPKY